MQNELLRRNGSDSAPGEQSVHYRALDGLRGVALLGVVYFHLTVVPQGDHPYWTFPFMAFGAVGVNVFFVLSGFLITDILIRFRQAENYFSAFYMRRVLRLAPLYYATLIVTFVILPILPLHAETYPFRTQIWYWLDLSNIPMALGHPFVKPLGPYWTLAIEEQFYLLWPVLVYRFSNRSLIRICGALILVALLARSIPALLHWDVVGTLPLTSRLTVMQWDGLFAGALIALAVRERWLTVRALPWLRISVLPLTFVAWELVRRFPSNLNTIWSPLMNNLFSVAIVATVVLESGTGIFSRVLSQRFLRLLGRYSYCMYVVHVPLVLWVSRHIDQVGPTPVRMAMVYAAYCAAVLAIGACSWVLLERPILSLKRHYPYRNR